MSKREVPASIGQRLLWLLDHYRGADGALNIAVLFRLRGALDVLALAAAVNQLSHRHEALRTTFAGRGRLLTQLIHDPEPLAVVQRDLCRADDPEAALQQAVREELRTRIDLGSWPLRVTLWRVAAREHVLCLNMHHLVTDAWSCGVVSRELGLLYDRLVAGGPEPPRVDWQYNQFVEWQQQTLVGDRLRGHEDYWRRQLQGGQLPSLPARATRLEPGATRPAERIERVAIEPPVVRALQQLARSHRTTLFAVMLALYYALLHRLTGQNDLAVASLLANRLRPELRYTVGFLANMVVLRTRFEPAASFPDILQATRATVIDAFVHQELPYQLLPLDTMHANALLDVVFQMMAEPTHQLQVADLQVEPMDAPDGLVSRFDLDFALIPRRGGLEALLGYAPDRFDGAWAHDMASGYARLARTVAGAPDSRRMELHP